MYCKNFSTLKQTENINGSIVNENVINNFQFFIV